MLEMRSIGYSEGIQNLMLFQESKKISVKDILLFFGREMRLDTVYIDFRIITIKICSIEKSLYTKGIFGLL